MRRTDPRFRPASAAYCPALAVASAQAASRAAAVVSSVPVAVRVTRAPGWRHRRPREPRPTPRRLGEDLEGPPSRPSTRGNRLGDHPCRSPGAPRSHWTEGRHPPPRGPAGRHLDERPVLLAARIPLDHRSRARKVSTSRWAACRESSSRSLARCTSSAGCRPASRTSSGNLRDQSSSTSGRTSGWNCTPSAPGSTNA